LADQKVTVFGEGHSFVAPAKEFIRIIGSLAED
jgi:uncharacterized phosphosugar-binding protein